MRFKASVYWFGLFLGLALLPALAPLGVGSGIFTLHRISILLLSSGQVILLATLCYRLQLLDRLVEALNATVGRRLGVLTPSLRVRLSVAHADALPPTEALYRLMSLQR